jgi:branched-chain amino acid transport system permease protein
MQTLIFGIIQGLLISLTATGFSVVYNSTKILHIAQGAIFALSPFLLYEFIHSGFGVLLAIIATLTISVLISMSIELINHWSLQKKGASNAIHLISSLGIFIVIIQLISIIWGNEAKVLRDGIDITYTISDIIITKSQVLEGLLSLFVLGVFFFWLKGTASGLKFIALSDNPVQFSLMGYDISKLRLLAFGISGILTAIASMLSALDVGFDPQGGLNAVLLAIVATIIGGRGSVIGPVMGGILLGIVRTQVEWYASATWQNAVTFLILVLFLFFRPHGLFGKKGRIESL